MLVLGVFLWSLIALPVVLCFGVRVAAVKIVAMVVGGVATTIVWVLADRFLIDLYVWVYGFLTENVFLQLTIIATVSILMYAFVAWWGHKIRLIYCLWAVASLVWVGFCVWLAALIDLDIVTTLGACVLMPYPWLLHLRRGQRGDPRFQRLLTEDQRSASRRAR